MRLIFFGLAKALPDPLPIPSAEDMTMEGHEEIIRAGEEALAALAIEKSFDPLTQREAFVAAVKVAADKMRIYLELVLKHRGDSFGAGR